MRTRLTITILIGATSAQALGGVVYTQALPDEPIGFGYFSHSAPRATHSFKHADNFTLGSDSTIRRVSWFGIGEGEQGPGLENVSSFTIELWSSRPRANGLPRPDTLITSETFGVGATDPSATGRTDDLGAIEFGHSVDLTSAWALSADTTYWISISAESIDPTGDAWKWRDSVDVDRISNSLSYSSGRWLNIIDTDSAFTLSSVPTPGSGVVVALGLLGLARRR